jgi:hypothetical protein
MQAQAQALMRDPEAARQIMNSPMMQSLMSNPDIIRDMITSNPQMQAMLDANPHIRHVLNDPAVIPVCMHACVYFIPIYVISISCLLVSAAAPDDGHDAQPRGDAGGHAPPGPGPQ